MTSFRLRVRTTEIDLPAGELAIGRGADCFLRIDDDLVSRKHARLVVSEDKVVFQDLGSRNGTRVNGEKIEGTVDLKVGDIFEIGSQKFQLLKGSSVSRSTQTMLPQVMCKSCKLLISAMVDTCPSCGALQSAEASTNDHHTGEVKPVSDSAKVFGASFKLLTDLGDKLMGLGRFEEAERMVGPRLKDALARVQRGDELSDATVREAIARGVRLAVATTRSEWYAWIFEFAQASRRRLDDATLNELHANMMLHKPAATDAVQRYYAAQRADDTDAAPHRKRIEALMRFCRN